MFIGADVQSLEELTLCVLSRLEEAVHKTQHWQEIEDTQSQLVRDFAFQEWLFSQGLEHYYHKWVWLHIKLIYFYHLLLFMFSYFKSLYESYMEVDFLSWQIQVKAVYQVSSVKFWYSFSFSLNVLHVTLQKFNMS